VAHEHVCVGLEINAVKTKRVYKRKLRFSALAFIDADREISGRQLQNAGKTTHRRLYQGDRLRD